MSGTPLYSRHADFLKLKPCFPRTTAKNLDEKNAPTVRKEDVRQITDYEQRDGNQNRVARRNKL